MLLILLSVKDYKTSQINKGQKEDRSMKKKTQQFQDKFQKKTPKGTK